MVAYSFQKRFVGHVQAGLEPGPWCPGMKRHTLRLPRAGRAGHARPEQAVQLYTGMRTRHCRLIGRAVARVQIPIIIYASDGVFTLARQGGAAPRSKAASLAPIVRDLLEGISGFPLCECAMEEFARADGFASTAEMRAFFAPPPAPESDPATMEMVLIGWTPVE